jgi:hypothetical protein
MPTIFLVLCHLLLLLTASDLADRMGVAVPVVDPQRTVGTWNLENGLKSDKMKKIKFTWHAQHQIGAVVACLGISGAGVANAVAHVPILGHLKMPNIYKFTILMDCLFAPDGIAGVRRSAAPTSPGS